LLPSGSGCFGFGGLLRCLLMRHVSEIAFLCGTLENVIGRIGRQGLNAHKLPALLTKSTHIATGERATPLIRSYERFDSFDRDTPTVVNIYYLICPLIHSALLLCARSFSNS